MTSGLRIYAKVTLCERQEAEAICQKFQQSEKSDLKAAASVGITAGEGVGIVTLPGLEQSIGAPAINRVPREMITKEVQAVCEKYHYTEGVEVCISVPNGVWWQRKPSIRGLASKAASQFLEPVALWSR